MSQYFIMINTTQPNRIIPLVDSEGDVLLMPSMGVAISVAEGNMSAQGRGYEIYERKG